MLKEKSFHAIKLNSISVKKGNILIALSDYIVSKDDSEAKFTYTGGMQYVHSYNRGNDFKQGFAQ